MCLSFGFQWRDEAKLITAHGEANPKIITPALIPFLAKVVRVHIIWEGTGNNNLRQSAIQRFSAQEFPYPFIRVG
jgi:hypothetical protein